MDKGKITTKTWLIIVIIVIILLIYVASIGQVGANNVRIADELSESREKAKHRHQKLEALINKQKDLKKNLERKFKRIYLGVRIILVLLWVALMTLLSFTGLITSVGDFLTYSQFSVMLIATLHFITFGSLSNLNEFISSLKRRTENWVYGKYLDIEEKIEANEGESEKLQSKIKLLDQSIAHEGTAIAVPISNARLESSEVTNER